MYHEKYKQLYDYIRKNLSELFNLNSNTFFDNPIEEIITWKDIP